MTCALAEGDADQMDRLTDLHDLLIRAREEVGVENEGEDADRRVLEATLVFGLGEVESSLRELMGSCGVGS